MEAEVRGLSLDRKAVKGKVKLKIRVNGRTYTVYGSVYEGRDYIAVEVEYMKPDEDS